MTNNKTDFRGEGAPTGYRTDHRTDQTDRTDQVDDPSDPSDQSDLPATIRKTIGPIKSTIRPIRRIRPIRPRQKTEDPLGPPAKKNLPPKNNLRESA